MALEKQPAVGSFRIAEALLHILPRPARAVELVDAVHIDADVEQLWNWTRATRMKIMASGKSLPLGDVA